MGGETSNTIGGNKVGDRISIQFKNGEDKSAVLFSHWDGLSLIAGAEDYVRTLVMDNIVRSKGKENPLGIYPLDRLEPATVMVSFISEIIGSGNRITGNYYLPRNIEEGDNSDNGHFIIDIDKIEKSLWDAYRIGIEKNKG